MTLYKLYFPLLMALNSCCSFFILTCFIINMFFGSLANDTLSNLKLNVLLLLALFVVSNM